MVPFIILLALSVSADTSDTGGTGPAPPDRAKSNWELHGEAEASAIHTLNSHWADEEKHCLFVHTDLSLEPEWEKRKWQFKSTLEIALTYQKSGREPWRIPEDHLEYTGKAVYDVHPWLDAAMHADFSSQLFPGYDYYSDWVHSRYTSNFMAPASLVYGLGVDLTRDSIKLAMIFSPLSWKMTFVLDRSLDETLFDLDSGATVTSESGAYITIDFEREIIKKTFVDLRGTVFMDYRELGEIDYFLKSSIDFKPVSFLTVGWDFRMMYDKDIRVKVYEDINGNGQCDDFPSMKSLVQLSSRVKAGLQFQF